MKSVTFSDFEAFSGAVTDVGRSYRICAFGSRLRIDVKLKIQLIIRAIGCGCIIGFEHLLQI